MANKRQLFVLIAKEMAIGNELAGAVNQANKPRHPAPRLNLEHLANMPIFAKKNYLFCSTNIYCKDDIAKNIFDFTKILF